MKKLFALYRRFIMKNVFDYWETSSEITPCPYCNNLVQIGPCAMNGNEFTEWEILCDQEDHSILISGKTKNDVIEKWDKFTKGI